jgi:TrmH family RNA methyltransferase
MITVSVSGSPNVLTTAQITSARNPALKEIRKAVARGTLTESGYVVAESFHLLEEAVRSECEIGGVFASESVRTTVETRVKGLRNVAVTTIPDELFREISATETSQGVITLVRPRTWDMDRVFRAQSLVVILDGIQDPGNAGTILRAAEAFAATGALLLKGTVNPFNPKAVRASAGSVFRLPFVAQLDTDIALAACKQRRIDLFAARPDGERALTQVDLRRRCAIVIGSEGRGVSEALRVEADGLRIPMAAVESLNAALAAGILLYEARRQRRLEE